MRNAILCICLFITTAFCANQFLVRVDNLDKAKKDFRIVEIVGNHFFILADDNDLARLKTRNYASTVLDSDPLSKDYYLVFPVDPQDPQRSVSFNRSVFEKYGRVLEVVDHFLVMQAKIEDLERITEYIFELNYVEKDPITFNDTVDPEYMAIHKRPVQTNKFITDMIARFEQTGKDSADKCERTLCAFKNRFCQYKYMKNEVNPWLKEKLKAYGCDSIIETPVSSNAPVISGVRYGKKNPGLLNGFVSIMGGHTDNKVSGWTEETRHQGAWDGGSQGVGYLEAARLLQYYTFENTIVFSSFSGEELGMLGANALLGQWKTAGVKTICGWNYDMIGWSGSVSLSTGTAAGSTELATKMKSLYATYNLSKYVKLNGEENPSAEGIDERGTDLSAYNSKGYMAIQFMGGAPGCQIHTPSDTINSQFDGQKLASACIIGAVTLMEYAVPVDFVTNNKEKNLSDTKNYKFNIQNSHGTVSIRYTSENKIVPLSITIYNSGGRALTTLIPQKQANGTYTAEWNHTGKLVDGMYVLQCRTTGGAVSQKILVGR